MLCRDREALSGCDVVFENRRAVVLMRGGGERYVLNPNSLSALTYEELSGRLEIVLADGGFVELLPQSAEDRDTVSSILASYSLLRDPSAVDAIGRGLRGFRRSVDAVLKLAAALGDTERGIDWESLSELGRQVAGLVESDEGLRGSLSERELRCLADSVSQRDLRSLVGCLKSVLTSLYRSAASSMSGVLPGTAPEVILDVALAAALRSAHDALGLPPERKDAARLEELLDSTLRRFAKVMSVEEPLLRELADSLRAERGAEEQVESIVGALRRG